MNKNIIVFALVMITLGSIATYAAPSAFAAWLIDRSGTLVKLDPLVLGDSDEQKSEPEKVEEKREERKSEEVKSEQTENRSTENKTSEANREAAEKRSEAEKKSLEKARERAQKKLEQTVKNNEINAIKNKVEKESEIEVDGNKLKIKQKTRDANGRETETELQMENGEELQVESRNGDESKKFKLRARQDDTVEVERDGVKVGTKLPISVNENNELVVTHPDGTTKVVAVMPDQALKMLREQNITPSDTDTDVNGDSVDLPELEEEDGQSVYKIDGRKEEKVLGLFKVAYKTKAVVSAETGEIVRTELSGLDRFFSLFSF